MVNYVYVVAYALVHLLYIMLLLLPGKHGFGVELGLYLNSVLNLCYNCM